MCRISAQMSTQSCPGGGDGTGPEVFALMAYKKKEIRRATTKVLFPKKGTSHKKTLGQVAPRSTINCCQIMGTRGPARGVFDPDPRWRGSTHPVHLFLASGWVEPTSTSGLGQHTPRRPPVFLKHHPHKWRIGGWGYEGAFTPG